MAQIENLKTKQKFKKTEAGEIPVEWEVASLGSICEVIGGSTPSTGEKKYWDGEILWATPTDITKLKGNAIASTEKKITEEGLANCAAKVLPVGSILLTSRATIGACAINTKPMATNQGFASLICGDNVYNLYIFYKIISLKDELERLANGSTFKEVSKSSIRMKEVALPPCSEQKKIAEILLTIDSAIEKISQLIEKKKELKKGLMQELLTGKRRVKVGSMKYEVGGKFKKTEIGEISDRWEIIKLENILTLNYGDGLPEEKRKAGVYPVYGSNGVIGYHDTALVKGPGIIVGRKGTIGSVEWSENDFWPIDTTYYTSTDKEKVNLRWLYYQLQILKLNKLNTATGIPGLNREVALNSSVPYPPILEQKKIAEILSDIDADIEQEVSEKEKMKQLKKGLMQVLLTGKVRVKI